MFAAFQTIRELRVHEMVIEPPTDILGANAGALAPPRVVIRSRSELAERVHISGPGEFIEPGALFGQKPSIILVGLGILKIDLAMGDIEIAEDDHILSLCPHPFAKL